MKKRRTIAKIGIVLAIVALVTSVVVKVWLRSVFRESAMCNDTVIQSAIENTTGRVAILAVRECGATAQDEVMVLVANSMDSILDPENLVLRGPWYDVRREYAIEWENNGRIRFSQDDEVVFLKVR